MPNALASTSQFTPFSFLDRLPDAIEMVLSNNGDEVEMYSYNKMSVIKYINREYGVKAREKTLQDIFSCDLVYAIKMEVPNESGIYAKRSHRILAFKTYEEAMEAIQNISVELRKALSLTGMNTKPFYTYDALENTVDALAYKTIEQRMATYTSYKPILAITQLVNKKNNRDIELLNGEPEQFKSKIASIIGEQLYGK